MIYDTRTIQAALCFWGLAYPDEIKPSDYKAPGDVDGAYGPRTAEAVKSFQAWDKITVDGICGPETWRSLAGFIPPMHPPIPSGGGIESTARALIVSQWPEGVEASPAAYQAAQAIARLETFYGKAWKGTGIGSHNWGAVQSGRPQDGVCPGGFLYTDTRPNSDGTSTPYSVCFKSYDTDALGCAGFLSVLLTGHIGQYVDTVIRSGSAFAVATAMHSGGYFEGYGATVQERINHYASAIAHNAAAIGASIGEGSLVT